MADDKKPQKQDRNEVARIVAGVILLGLLIAFIVDNTRTVKVGFVFANKNTRMIYVLVVTAIIGAILDRLWIHHRKK